MTACDLIALLSLQPPDRTVLVDGYEGGYDDINSTEDLEITEAGDAGCFDEAYVEASELPDSPSRRALVLSRRRGKGQRAD